MKKFFFIPIALVIILLFSCSNTTNNQSSSNNPFTGHSFTLSDLTLTFSDTEFMLLSNNIVSVFTYTYDDDTISFCGQTFNGKTSSTEIGTYYFECLETSDYAKVASELNIENNENTIKQRLIEIAELDLSTTYKCHYEIINNNGTLTLETYGLYDTNVLPFNQVNGTYAQNTEDDPLIGNSYRNKYLHYYIDINSNRYISYSINYAGNTIFTKDTDTSIEVSFSEPFISEGNYTITASYNNTNSNYTFYPHNIFILSYYFCLFTYMCI